MWTRLHIQFIDKQTQRETVVVNYDRDLEVDSQPLLQSLGKFARIDISKKKIRNWFSVDSS